MLILRFILARFLNILWTFKAHFSTHFKHTYFQLVVVKFTINCVSKEYCGNSFCERSTKIGASNIDRFDRNKKPFLL